MTSIHKPQGPAVSTKSLGAGFDKVRDAMDELKTTRGNVNVAKLEKKIAETGDVSASKALDAIKDEYSTQVSRIVSDCGGSRRVTDEAEPKTLKKEEVQSIFSALIDAKSKANKIDKNKDGAISEVEAGSGRQTRGFAGEIVKAAIAGNQAKYEDAMDEWRYALADTAYTVEERVYQDDEIKTVAKYHGKTKLGREALTWAFRNLATGHDNDAVGRMDGILDRAETGGRSPLMAMFQPGDIKRGHLDTNEVKQLLGTDDLRGFIQETRAAIEDRVGGSYHRHYLKGKDLPGHDQINDPDFDTSTSSYTSSC